MSEIEIRHIMSQIMTNQVSDCWLASFLSLLAAKGETPDEIAYLVKTIQRYIPKFREPLKQSPIDLVGTGGDNSNSLNISTVSALVVAACGVSVAKHGNRSVSSSCGSADLLEAWGIRFSEEGSLVEGEYESSDAIKNLQECGITFFYAPLYNPVMSRLSPVRKPTVMR